MGLIVDTQEHTMWINKNVTAMKDIYTEMESAKSHGTVV